MIFNFPVKQQDGNNSPPGQKSSATTRQQNSGGFKMCIMTDDRDNPFTIYKIMLQLYEGKLVTIIGKTGALIRCRIKQVDWPYINTTEAYIEYSDVKFTKPWALIHTDEIRILFPAEEIQNETSKNTES
jgi:hypothetical protein